MHLQSEVISEVKIRVKRTGQDLLELSGDINTMRCQDEDVVADLVKTSADGTSCTGRKVEYSL